MVFVRKKRIKGRGYYYIVKSTRISPNKWKKIERYVGINPPSKKELKEYEIEFDNIKDFFSKNKEEIEKTRKIYLKKKKRASKDELRNLENEIAIRFTYDTNRIEGSTLTYKDTKMLLEEGISPREKPIRDIKEAENHKKAFLYMKNNLSKDVSKGFILELHKMLKENVTEDAGRFRTAQVMVGNLVPVKPDMIETEIKNLLGWYKKSRNLHPLELASVLHCIFERIHPFFDGNGRIGRLLLNFILLKNNYPVTIIQAKNKRRYYTCLRHADSGNYFYMIKYLFDEMRKQVKEHYS